MTLSLAEARALHAEVPVIDLHADTPMLVHTTGYDPNKRHVRRVPKRLNYAGHVDAPRMREGGVSAQIFGMWTVPYPERLCPGSIHKQLDALDGVIAASEGGIVRCWTGQDVWQAKAKGAIAALAGIEGGQALHGDASRVAEFARRGVRYIGLLHFSSNALGKPAFGKGSDDSEGLTQVGRDVIAEMQRCGVIVDLAHINRKGFYEALDELDSPPMVTHTGLSGVHEHWRNIDDQQIRAVANAGGCIGIIFARKFLGGKSIDKLCDHIIHLINIAGEDVPALGSDFDGFVIPPDGLEDISLVPHLTKALSERGLSNATLQKMLARNALRVLDEVQPNFKELGLSRPETHTMSESS
jgi:membrane dipeptidase